MSYDFCLSYKNNTNCQKCNYNKVIGDSIEITKNRLAYIDSIFNTVLDSNNNYSLLRLNPETGKKHQLRKQLLIHGNPILGDSKYRISKNYSSKRNTLMLHAYKINFSIAGTKYNYSAEPPLAFKNTLKEKYLKSF